MLSRRRGVLAGVGQAERRHDREVLAVDAERLAARRDDAQARAVREQAIDERGRVRHEVLAVVHDEQGVAGLERVDEPLEAVTCPARRGGLEQQVRLARAEDGEQGRDEVVSVGQRRELGEPDAAGGRRDELGRELARQARLAGSAGADERHQAVAREQRADPLALLVTADEARQRGAQVAAPGPRRGGGGRWPVAADDGQVRVAQVVRGGDAELVVKARADALVGGERVGLPAGGVERGDVLRGEALVQGMARDERFELGDKARRRPEREVGVDPVGDRGQPQVLEARGGRRGEAPLLGDPGERRAAPEPQRVAHDRAGTLVLARLQRGRALRGEALEAQRVDGVGLDRQAVAAGALLDERAVAEAAPQPRDERLQGVQLVGGLLVVPDRVGERGRRHDAARVERQPREQREQAAAADLAGVGLERPKDRDAHATYCATPRSCTTPRTTFGRR